MSEVHIQDPAEGDAALIAAAYLSTVGVPISDGHETARRFGCALLAAERARQRQPKGTREAALHEAANVVAAQMKRWPTDDRAVYIAGECAAAVRALIAAAPSPAPAHDARAQQAIEEGRAMAAEAAFPVVSRWTMGAKDAGPRARVWVQFEDGGAEVEFAAAALQASASTERANPYGRCTITGPAEDVAFIFRHLPDVDAPTRTPVSAPAPIDMVLHCPACGLQHIDAPEPAVRTALDPNGVLDWPNPPHRSHLCHGCGHIWRPADVPTNGVQAVQTKGKADSPIRAPAVGDAT